MLKTQENKYVYAYVQRTQNYVQSKNDTDCMTTHMAFFFVPHSSMSHLPKLQHFKPTDHFKGTDSSSQQPCEVGNNLHGH